MSRMSNADFERIRLKISICDNLTVLLKCFNFGDPRVTECVQKRFDCLANEISDFRDSEFIAKKLKASQV